MRKVANASGGAAAAGGFDFHAALGAIAYVHVLRGSPLPWTDDWTASPPTAVSFETAGPGDDISITLSDGTALDVQAKKGLTATSRFWSSLESLCGGINAERCDYGILAVCPQSSLTVRKKYASAFRRLGAQRHDGASKEQIELQRFLTERGYDVAEVCSRVRIKTVPALPDDDAAVAGACSDLSHVIAHAQQARLAWSTLYRVALAAISERGRKTLTSLTEVLRAAPIELARPPNDSAAVVLASLLDATRSRTADFEILGVPIPLSTDDAWLPLEAVVHDEYVDAESSVEEALEAYRRIGVRSDQRRDGTIDAKTIGTFRKLCVVLGGPGSGKSLLLKVLAREFTKDSVITLRVRLRDLARRMERDGCGVEEGILRLGLDGTGVSAGQLSTASVPEVVMLCDGLDECAHQQSAIASGLRSIADAHPSYRIVVTTRPIGYYTSQLRSWRHYELLPLASTDVRKNLESLCRSAVGSDETPDDDLADRIETYLKEGGSEQNLGGTPLLLAFHALLVLKSPHPCRRKADLYARIFKLIDDAPSPRKERTADPPKAIRDSVLNVLGWQTFAGPLLPAEELERRCAKVLQAETGAGNLQALSDVQQAIKYWDNAGLIERLQHADSELIAFVHKTCGEFAAARHLADMEPDKACQVIQPTIRNSGWGEILDFSTETRLATSLARLLLGDLDRTKTTVDDLSRLLRVVVRPETVLSITEQRSFLEHLFRPLWSEDRRKVYRTALRILQHDLRRLPHVDQFAFELCTASFEWSRLAGWAILSKHCPDRVDANGLEAALHHFVLRSEDGDLFPVRYVGSFPVRTGQVFEEFLLSALKLLLSGKGVRYQDDLIASLRPIRHTLSMSCMSKFRALLVRIGRQDVWPAQPQWPGASIRDEWTATIRHERNLAFVLTDVISAAFAAQPSGEAPETGPKYLSAFLSMSNMLESPYSDVHVWKDDSANSAEVQELLRAAGSVFGLPAGRLAGEASGFMEAMEALSDDEKMSSVLEILPQVDPCEPQWQRAAIIRMDDEMLEALIHHPSIWVSRLAAIFLDERLENGQRERVCERILGSGMGLALLWGAALASRLPEGRLREVILRRLEEDAVEGMQHLFDTLRREKVPVASTQQRILERSLLQSNPKVADGAAKWCEAMAGHAEPWLRALLVRAMEYWVEHEEPYPVGGGLVPDSPRETLLRTLLRADHYSLEKLANLTEDGRRDVADAAVDGLVEIARGSSKRRRELVEMIRNRRFGANVGERLLDVNVPYTARELSWLSRLRNDIDPDFRVFVVRRVFGHPRMCMAEARAKTVALTQDENGKVRDAAYEFLETAESE